MQISITISEASRRSGVAASALRFYEDRGLIQSHRTGSGHRRYHRDVLRRIAFVVFAQKIGMSLEEVHVELAKLPTDRVPEGQDWTELSNNWMQRIDERIQELERLRIGLNGCIGCGCLSLEHCRLVNPKDRAATLGPGPRQWIGKTRSD